MSDENEIRCPGCDKPMQRLSTRSEPEGIRGDAYCSTCGVTYMVTKAGCVKLPYPPAVATKDGGAPARPSTTSPAAPAPTELPELDERHQAIAQQSATYFNTFRREADAITAVVSALVSRTHRMVLVKEIENAIATAEDSDSPRTDLVKILRGWLTPEGEKP